MKKNLSLVHETREPRTPSSGAPPLLLLLHGIGSNEQDLIGLAPDLDGRFFCVSARAPFELGEDAYAWFHVKYGADGTVIRPDEAESSRILLVKFVDELVSSYGLDAKKVFLMGFSQGAIMCLSVALTRPDKVAGIVAMSGRLLPEVLPLVAEVEALTSLPVFVAHGTMDGVLPIGQGRSARDKLSDLSVDLDYREYPMGHEISKESLGDVAGWLSKRLGK
jgi:phospholipase/carboxylesterase